MWLHFVKRSQADIGLFKKQIYLDDMQVNISSDILGVSIK